MSHIPGTPMVPAILVRCAEFLEAKGIDEVGLYRYVSLSFLSLYLSLNHHHTIHFFFTSPFVHFFFLCQNWLSFTFVLSHFRCSYSLSLSVAFFFFTLFFFVFAGLYVAVFSLFSLLLKLSFFVCAQLALLAHREMIVDACPI